MIKVFLFNLHFILESTVVLYMVVHLHRPGLMLILKEIILEQFLLIIVYKIIRNLHARHNIDNNMIAVQHKPYIELFLFLREKFIMVRVDQVPVHKLQLSLYLLFAFFFRVFNMPEHFTIQKAYISSQLVYSVQFLVYIEFYKVNHPEEYFLGSLYFLVFH